MEISDVQIFDVRTASLEDIAKVFGVSPIVALEMQRMERGEYDGDVQAVYPDGTPIPGYTADRADANQKRPSEELGLPVTSVVWQEENPSYVGEIGNKWQTPLRLADRIAKGLANDLVEIASEPDFASSPLASGLLREIQNVVDSTGALCAAIADVSVNRNVSSESLRQANKTANAFASSMSLLVEHFPFFSGSVSINVHVFNLRSTLTNLFTSLLPRDSQTAESKQVSLRRYLKASDFSYDLADLFSRKRLGNNIHFERAAHIANDINKAVLHDFSNQGGVDALIATKILVTVNVAQIAVMLIKYELNLSIKKQL